MCIAVADACNSGGDVDTAPTDSSRRAQTTVAMLGRLDQMHRVTRLPTFALKSARNLPIKPVVSFRESARSVEARPLTRRSGISTVRTAAPAGTRDQQQNTRHRDAHPMQARRVTSSRRVNGNAPSRRNHTVPNAPVRRRTSGRGNCGSGVVVAMKTATDSLPLANGEHLARTLYLLCRVGELFFGFEEPVKPRNEGLAKLAVDV